MTDKVLTVAAGVLAVGLAGTAAFFEFSPEDGVDPGMVVVARQHGQAGHLGQHAVGQEFGQRSAALDLQGRASIRGQPDGAHRFAAVFVIGHEHGGVGQEVQGIGLGQRIAQAGHVVPIGRRADAARGRQIRLGTSDTQGETKELHGHFEDLS